MALEHIVCFYMNEIEQKQFVIVNCFHFFFLLFYLFVEGDSLTLHKKTKNKVKNKKLLCNISSRSCIIYHINILQQKDHKLEE